jgi:hypothetical protein
MLIKHIILVFSILLGVYSNQILSMQNPIESEITYRFDPEIGEGTHYYEKVYINADGSKKVVTAMKVTKSFRMGVANTSPDFYKYNDIGAGENQYGAQGEWMKTTRYLDDEAQQIYQSFEATYKRKKEERKK